LTTQKNKNKKEPLALQKELKEPHGLQKIQKEIHKNDLQECRPAEALKKRKKFLWDKK